MYSILDSAALHAYLESVIPEIARPSTGGYRNETNCQRHPDRRVFLPSLVVSARRRVRDTTIRAAKISSFIPAPAGPVHVATDQRDTRTEGIRLATGGRMRERLLLFLYIPGSRPALPQRPGPRTRAMAHAWDPGYRIPGGIR